MRHVTRQRGIPWWDHQLHYLVAHGLNILIGLGAGAGALGVAGGAWLALRYGRRASVSVAAVAHSIPGGLVVVSTRPVVKAVGVRRVEFKEKGVTVRVAEVYVQDGDLHEGRFWVEDGAFAKEYVDAGEELSTTVVFAPTQPPASVIGWTVYLRVAAPVLLPNWRTNSWADQCFVIRPGGNTLDGL